MSRFNVMPRHIPIPELDDNDIALIIVDSKGNHTVNAITRHAVNMAEPAAWALLLKELISRLDEQRDYETIDSPIGPLRGTTYDLP